MDEKVQFIDDIKPLQDTDLYRVRSIEGVEWAVPLYKGLIRARLQNGTFQTCNVIGLDDATLIGGTPKMLEGKLEDLRIPAAERSLYQAEDQLADSRRTVTVDLVALYKALGGGWLLTDN